MPTLRPFFLPLLLAGTLVLTGCEADGSMADDDTAVLTLDLEPVVGSEALSDDPAAVYDVNGQHLTFASARMYLSEITLIRKGGEEVRLAAEPVTAPALDADSAVVAHTLAERVVLARHDAGEARYELGEVPAGVYEGVRFKVGLTGLTNRLDATQVPASHPLAQQTDKNNHWSWNAGYIYLRIDGLLDLDGDGAVEAEGTDGAAWNVHLGTDAFAETVELDGTFTLEAGQMQDLHIVADYAALIQDIDFADPAQRICHTMNNLPVAEAVRADVAGAFGLHGIDGHEN